ncbi:hypothetical protein B0E46_05170 [Rhodanobacter sp. B04]|uniref:hypothetical protein n=1 Tax=Rhodanobacter sp. B04 TaxID=1945860 RepID=UPI000986C27F|nr:hypothetical protein [Rhodanobacter sp. B04]OOG64797.1 hypothetical protein B0E46_05170 [Rhodanobacter sp. B04]
MTITRIATHFSVMHALLFVGIAALLPLAAACAQSTQARAAQFQQTVQQQQTRDQLQKSQQQQQLRQDVSDNAKLPLANNAQAQQQIRQADRAQQDRDRATQQDLLSRQQSAAGLPRVVPQPQPQPAPTSGG